MRRLTSEDDLLARAREMLPKRIPREAITSVEIDYCTPWAPSGVSYWVYLRSGFVTENGAGCHKLHEDTLRELKDAMRDIVYKPDDEESGYGRPLDEFPTAWGESHG